MKGHPMFGRKRKAKAITAEPTALPIAYEVWYRDSIGRWTFSGKHSNVTDARKAVRAFTIAQVEIREIYA